MKQEQVRVLLYLPKPDTQLATIAPYINMQGAIPVRDIDGENHPGFMDVEGVYYAIAAMQAFNAEQLINLLKFYCRFCGDISESDYPPLCLHRSSGSFAFKADDLQMSLLTIREDVPPVKISEPPRIPQLPSFIKNRGLN